MKLILFLLALPLLNNTCSKNRTAIPACVNEKIEQIKKEPKWNPPAEVNEYIYNGKHVFLFSSNCCDQYNNLYDKDCNFICAPSGGFTGKGDNKCNDFFQSAKHVKLIWKDDR
jgi:hypothetical protein